MSIFDSHQFMPRGQCGAWTEPWLSLYLDSNLAIFFAYLAMPLIFVCSGLWREPDLSRVSVTDVVMRRIIYSLFIFFCGVGHLFDGVLVFTWPAYKFFAVWHCATAIVSWAAVFLTFRYRAKILTAI